jgi:hypothetical protein
MTINNYPHDWQDALHLKLVELRRRFPQAHIYALIEGVLNETCYPFLKRAGNLPFFALYTNTPGADEETLCVSPILVEYLESATYTWEALLKKTNGVPALSLIITTESLMQVADRLTPWCVVDAAEHTLALSYADTRILPELFKVLTPQQLAQFCGPALQWEYVTRKAEWQALPLPKTEAVIAAPADSVVLCDAQCAELMEASEADSVLFQLRRSAANLVNCHTPARAHELVCYWLACADHAQISAAPERTRLCDFGLSYPHLAHSPQITAWLNETSRPQSYEDLHAKWSANDTLTDHPAAKAA